MPVHSAPPEVLEVDHALTSLEKELQLLLNITPVNAAEAWTDFERNGFAQSPMLRSRPLEFEPDLVRRRLYELQIERVEDPALAELLHEKRDEIARQITLLQDRDTSRFLYGSLMLWGDVDEHLVKDALELLSIIPNEGTADQQVAASGFAEAAQEELDRYRAAYPGFSNELEVRSDVSDLMVTHGRLLVPANAIFRSRRVEPLIQHEVGTHVVTYANGNAQPLKLFAVGLPGYEETQEGLAVLAEYALDGLDPQRLRLLAARVVAVHRMLEGAGFVQVFEELHESYGFHPKVAWGTTIRVNRSGGLTKDVIYLRGIRRVLEFVAERKDISALLVGKLSLDHVPLVEELLERGILQPAWIKPRWLDMGDAPERLARAYEGMTVLDLIKGDQT
ncbi:MAG TPA: tyrosine/phenylalanine carboxypeptidase domain-containing protein [Actinomycetota bacterium]|nr:tyrosine/phenylalanine carboxypeptidase domain-containing protein [Actinomycetota bacterium]